MPASTITSTAHDQLTRLLALLRGLRPDVRVVYAFGSVLTEHFTPDSDIDLAIDVGRPLTAIERFDLAGTLANAIGRDVDVVDFRQASTVLRHQVLTRGERLFVADADAQNAYEAAVLSEYMDFHWLRSAHLSDMIEEGTVYGRRR